MGRESLGRRKHSFVFPEEQRDFPEIQGQLKAEFARSASEFVRQIGRSVSDGRAGDAPDLLGRMHQNWSSGAGALPVDDKLGNWPKVIARRPAVQAAASSRGDWIDAPSAACWPAIGDHVAKQPKSDTASRRSQSQQFRAANRNTPACAQHEPVVHRIEFHAPAVELLVQRRNPACSTARPFSSFASFPQLP